MMKQYYSVNMCAFCELSFKYLNVKLLPAKIK